MRLPAASKDTTDSRKSIFAQGINLRTSQTSVSGGNNDAATLVMIKKLIKFKSIHDNLTSMLAENEREKLDQIKNATFAKRPTIEKDAKARISSQRKARNLFKEDLLYSTEKKSDQVDEVHDIQDYDQVIHDIEELKAERSKLIADTSKCDQFIECKCSSTYFRFRYLLSKLHQIRKCAQLSSTNGMLTADYFSVVLDKRKEMIDIVHHETENVENAMSQIHGLRKKFDNEIDSFLQGIDSDKSVFSEQNAVHQIEFSESSLPDRRLELLDEKLAAIIRAFKEKVAHTQPKKIKEKAEIDFNYDPAVTADDIARTSSDNFNIFKENVSNVMQRCFQMTEGRLQRLAASRKVLMEDRVIPENERIVSTVIALEDNIDVRQTSLTRMIDLERNLRQAAEISFEERARSLLTAVALSEQTSINHLKVEFFFVAVFYSLLPSPF
jgi:hypothetical protein